MRRLDGITNAMDINLGRLREIVSDTETRQATVHGVAKSRTRLSDFIFTFIDFLVVMYRCESWTIKKAECQRMMLLNCGAGEDS